MLYKFSAPMPLSISGIRELVEINNQIKKSKITSLYFSLPSNCKDFSGFENGRYITENITCFHDWKPLIEYSLKNNFDFVYLLNLPKVINPEIENIENYLQKTDKLIKCLKSLGCNKVRVCNPQLMGYLNKKYPEIDLYISTLAQMQNIKQYENVFYMFQNIKEFVPSFDLNKNFEFLKNIKKKLPNIDIELMVNEGCISGCPYQAQHSQIVNFKEKYTKAQYYFSTHFFTDLCSNRMHNNFEYFFCNSNIIYPWEIEEYSKIGINKFKLIGRNNEEFWNGKYIEYYKLYLLGVDNINNIKNIPIRFFNNYIINFNKVNYTVNELKDYIPNIKYFKKNGHLCSSRCGVNCNYCRKCAKKIKKILNKKQELDKRKDVSPCFISTNEVKL